MDNIEKKAINGVLWQFAEKAGTQLIALIVNIYIARLIDPSAFGVVALVNAFMAVLTIFVDSGLGVSLIQKKDADDIDFSTVFYTNIVLCVFIYAVIFFGSPLIARFYNQYTLTILLRISGISIVVSAFQNILQAYVTREMIFKKFFFASLAGTLAGGVVGIIMAINGYGVFALIASHLTNCIMDTIIIWITVKWKPKLVFSFKRLKTLFSFGVKILLSRLINTIYVKMYDLLIGKYYSMSDLAYFEKAENISGQTINIINQSIDSVLLPMLSSNQNDIVKIKELMKKSLRLCFYLVTPILVGLIVISDNLIVILLTEKWISIIPYFRILCLVNIFMPIHTINLNCILALGKSNYFLRQEIIKKCLGLITIFILIKYGLMPMAISLVVFDFVSQIINSFPNKKLVNYSYVEQIKDVLPSIIISVIMGVCVYLIGKINITSSLLMLFFQIVAGIVLYIVLSIITKNNEFIQIKNIIKSKLFKN